MLRRCWANTETHSDLMDFLKQILFLLLFPIMNLQDRRLVMTFDLDCLGVVSMLPQSHLLTPSSDLTEGLIVFTSYLTEPELT